MEEKNVFSTKIILFDTSHVFSEEKRQFLNDGNCLFIDHLFTEQKTIPLGGAPCRFSLTLHRCNLSDFDKLLHLTVYKLLHFLILV